MAVVIKIWDQIESYFAVALSFIALALLCWETAVRFFDPELAGQWTDDIIVFLIIWAIFISGSALIRDGRQMRFDMVIRIFPAETQRILEICIMTVGLLFCSIIGWYGIEVVTLAHQLGEQTESSLRLPLWIYYLCLPTGMALMCIRYLIRLKLYIFNFDPATMTIQDDDILHGN